MTISMGTETEAVRTSTDKKTQGGPGAERGRKATTGSAERRPSALEEP